MADARSEAEKIEKNIQRILKTPFWLPSINTQTMYDRLHDDHDGTGIGRIQVFFGPDGDAYLTTDEHRGSALRFRAPMGGSNSHYVRSALMILAYAIKMDYEEEEARKAKHPR